MRIGIVAPASDAEAGAVASRLKARGVDPFFVDLSGFPARGRFAVLAEDPLRLLADGDDVSDASAWYVRRWGFTDPLVRRQDVPPEEWAGMHGRAREWAVAETEKAMFVGSLLGFLGEHAPVVNPVLAFLEHLRKSHQVYRLKRAGLRVPDYYCGNDVEAAKAFLARHPRVVYKPNTGGRLVEEVPADVLAERSAALKVEPIVLQRLVEGRHVRAHVVGDRVAAAAEIQFDRAKGADSRASEKAVVRLDLDPDLAELCVRAARAARMDHAGVDVILAEDGPWFLEANPSAMFVNFDARAGTDVAQALAARLVELAKGK